MAKRARTMMGFRREVEVLLTANEQAGGFLAPRRLN